MPDEYKAGNPSLYKEGLLKNMIGYSEDGMMSMKAAENVYKVLVQFEPSVKEAGKMDLSQTFDNSYARKAAAKYKSPKDLKGLKVGVSAPGSSTNMVVNYVLAQGGLKPTDVAIIGVGAGATVIAAIEQGRVDVISQTDPAVTMLEKDGKVKVIAETRTPEGTQKLFGGPMPAGSFYAPIEFIKKNPNTVQALTNAMVRTLLWMQDATPQQILATVPEEYLLGNKAMYLFAYNNVKTAYSKDGHFSEAGAKTTLKALASFNENIKPESINLAQTYTNEFVKKAHAKYGKKKT